MADGLTFQRPYSNLFGSDMSLVWPTQTTQSTQSTGGDTLSRLLAAVQQQKSPAADAASVLGGFSSGEKANRVVEGNFTQPFDQMMLGNEIQKNQQMLQAQSDRNANEADALGKLSQTAFMKGGGSTFQMPTFDIGGKSYTPSAPPVYRSSPEEIAGASTLQDTIMSRFGEDGSYRPGYSYQPHPLESYARPGFGERLSSGAATGIGMVDSLLKLYGGGDRGIDGLISGLSGAGSNVMTNPATLGTGERLMGGAGGTMSGFLGKALPIAGAIPGAIGLLKDRGIGTNLMNGISSGASLGSFAGPIGTGVGAAIGAGVGALRSIGGGPSDEEKAGRVAASQAKNAITQSATPQQQQEASAAGWGDKQGDALTLIVMRDELMKAGKSPETANQYMNALHAAEKQGPQAVQSIIQQIMGSLGTGNTSGGFAPGPGQYRG